MVESEGCVRPFSYGITLLLVLKFHREAISTFTEGIYLIR